MSNKQRYIQICHQHKNIPLFLQPWWVDAVCENWDAAIVSKGETVTGIWPYPVEQKLGVVMLRTPILTPYLSPHIFFPPDLKPSNRDGFEQDVIEELVKQLPEAKMWHLTLQPGLKQAGIFSRYGVDTQVKQTFLVSLADEESTILGNMKENMRRNIRAGEKELEIADDDSQLPLLYNFISHTLSGKNKHVPYPLSHLQRVFNACKDNRSCALWVARRDNEVQAIVWHAWDAMNSYYLAGGQNPAIDSYRAMPKLLWHAMRHAKSMGNTIFDLEGSSDEGVERFFRGFGGQRELYLVLRRNDSLLWKMKETIKK